MSRWIVSVKGTPGNSGYEIAVIREDNEQGRHAYGFFGIDKLPIAHGNVVERPIFQEEWDEYMEAAHILKDTLNEE